MGALPALLRLDPDLPYLRHIDLRLEPIASAAGMIIIGVTNTSEACMWFESSNPIFGCSNNPYDLVRYGQNAAAAAAAAAITATVISTVAVVVKRHHPGHHPPPPTPLQHTHSAVRRVAVVVVRVPRWHLVWCRLP